MVNGGAQVLGNQLDGHHGAGIGHRGGDGGDIGFDGVGQGIHAGGGGETGWLGQHQLGSLTDISGVTCLSMMAIFTWRASSVMMQKRVISEAVPAVVLMAISGSCGLAERSTPS